MATALLKGTIYGSRDEWLAGRRNTIGASDAATVLGINPYKSAFTLHAEKTGEIPPFGGSIRTQIGHELEPLVTRLYEEATGVVLFDPGDFTTYSHPDHPWLRCTPDRMTMPNYDRAVELKTMGRRVAKKMQDNARLEHQVQLQIQLAILGLTAGDIAALNIEEGDDEKALSIFPYARNDRLLTAMLPRLKEFWDRVQANDPPPIDDTESTAATLRLLHPDDNGETVTLTNEACAASLRLAKIKEAMKQLEGQERQARNEIIACLGSATYGEGEGIKMSYRTQTRAGYLKVNDEERYVLDRVGIKFTETKGGAFRVLRQLKGATEK